MKVNNTTRFTLVLSTLCLASTLFCSVNAHTALQKGCYYANVIHPLGDKMTMVGTPMVCTYTLLPYGKVGYAWQPLPTSAHKIALNKPLKTENNVDTYIHNMQAKTNALNTARSNLADSVRYSSDENVRLVEDLARQAPLSMFNVGMETISPKVALAVNNTLAFYQRQRTNILLAALLGQQKRNLHCERLVNASQAYLRHFSNPSAYQFFRHLILLGQQAANVHHDTTVLRHHLPNATFNKTQYWDPSVTGKRDGQSFRLNPLDGSSFNQEVVFFNGDNDWQVAFARALAKRSPLPVVLIATQGNIKQLVHILQAPVYFAHEKIIRRLGITAVPTIVTRGLYDHANRLVLKTVKLPYRLLNQAVYEFTNAAFHAIGATQVWLNAQKKAGHVSTSADSDDTNDDSGFTSDYIIPAFPVELDKGLNAFTKDMHDDATAVSESKKKVRISRSAGDGGINVYVNGIKPVSKKQINNLAKNVLRQLAVLRNDDKQSIDPCCPGPCCPDPMGHVAQNKVQRSALALQYDLANVKTDGTAQDLVGGLWPNDPILQNTDSSK